MCNVYSCSARPSVRLNCAVPFDINVKSCKKEYAEVCAANYFSVLSLVSTFPFRIASSLDILFSSTPLFPPYFPSLVRFVFDMPPTKLPKEPRLKTLRGAMPSSAVRW